MRKAILAAVIAGAFATPALSASRIGVAASVVPAVTGAVNGANTTLKSGDQVFQNQVVSSDTGGSAQLMLLDETVFSIGPRSRVVLDKFVYNPQSKAGSVVVNVTRGAFRFITGSAKKESYRIKTPVATIGVRGTIFSGNLDGSGNLNLTLEEGAILICPTNGAEIEGGGENSQSGQQNCTLASEPGQYNVSNTGGAGSGPGGTDPGSDANDGADTNEDPFEPDDYDLYKGEGLIER